MHLFRVFALIWNAIGETPDVADEWRWAMQAGRPFRADFVLSGGGGYDTRLICVLVW